MKNVAGLVLLPVLTLLACGKDDKDKETGKAAGELQTVGSLALPAGNGAMGLHLDGVESTSNVTIESLKVPVFSMTISGAEGGGKVYECASTKSEDCLVELVGTNLTDLLASGSSGTEPIPAGLIDSMVINHKPAGCDGTEEAKTKVDEAATVRASGTIGGVTYYTNKAKGLSTTGPAESVSFGYGACSSTSKFYPGVELAKGETIIVKAFIDLQYLGSIRKVNTGAQGYCAVTDGVELCISAFNIAATADKGDPKVERYVLTPGNSGYGCGGFMAVFFDESDTPFGAYMRNYFYEGQNCDAGKLETATGGNFGVLKKNADGTLYLRDATIDLPARNTFSAFKREDHTGTVKAVQAVGAAETDVSYSAKKLAKP